MRRALPIATLCGGILLDRATKWIFFPRDVQSSRFGIHGVLELVHHQNYGAIANTPIPLFVLICISIIASIALVIGLIHAIRTDRSIQAIAFSLILAGAVGNLWDRLINGFVFDWILLAGRSAINIADMHITAGILLLLFTPNWSRGISTRDTDRVDSPNKTP